MTFEELKAAHHAAQKVANKAREEHHAALKTAEPLHIAASAALRAFETEPTQERAEAYMSAFKAMREADATVAGLWNVAEEARRQSNIAFSRYDAVRRLRDAASVLAQMDKNLLRDSIWVWSTYGWITIEGLTEWMGREAP